MKGEESPVTEEDADLYDAPSPPPPPDQGSFFSWGCGEFGQHCHQRSGDVLFMEGFVKKFSGSHGNKIKYMACGASHTIVVTNSNAVYAWGNGNSGQLGCGDKENHFEPVAIQLYALQPKNPKIRGVACGIRHSFVWLENGHVFSFGNNFFAQLGYDTRIKNYRDNQLAPHLLRTLTYRSVRQVSCGEKHSLFLFQDGTVAAVGNNTYGQIGTGDREEANTPRFQQDLEPIKFIACGSNHNLVITGGGDVYVWGLGKACGSKRQDLLTPQRKATRHRNIVSAAGGHTHSLALSGGGNVYSWGSGHEGQLGHGPKLRFSSSAQLIPSAKLRGRVVQVACGEAYSAAVTADGSLYMWGKNSHVLCPEKPTNLKLYDPICVNPPTSSMISPRGGAGISVAQVQCGAWHAVAMTGKPDWTKTDNVSDTEPDLQEKNGGCNQVRHKVITWDTADQAERLDDSYGSSQESDVDGPLSIGMQREKTTITLAEFYAPSPAASYLTGLDLSPDYMENSSPRSELTRTSLQQRKSGRSDKVEKGRLTVEVPRHIQDPDSNTEAGFTQQTESARSSKVSVTSSRISQKSGSVLRKTSDGLRSDSPDSFAHTVHDADAYAGPPIADQFSNHECNSVSEPPVEQSPFQQKNEILDNGTSNYRSKVQDLQTLPSQNGSAGKVTAYKFMLPRQETTLVPRRTLDFIPVDKMKPKARNESGFPSGIIHRIKSSRNQQRNQQRAAARNNDGVIHSVNYFHQRRPAVLNMLGAKRQQRNRQLLENPQQLLQQTASPAVLPVKSAVPRTLTLPRTVTCLLGDTLERDRSPVTSYPKRHVSIPTKANARQSTIILDVDQSKPTIPRQKTMTFDVDLRTSKMASTKTDNVAQQDSVCREEDNSSSSVSSRKPVFSSASSWKDHRDRDMRTRTGPNISTIGSAIRRLDVGSHSAGSQTAQTPSSIHPTPSSAPSLK